MKKWTAFLLAAILTLPAPPASAQHETKSLLWRITGKGMAHPSYLYGTIHLRTKKLFDFPDSLYSAIGNTEVFAGELNLDSLNSGFTAYMTDLMENEPEDSPRRKEKKLKDILTREERRELRELIAENAGVDPDDLTTRQIYMMRDKLAKHVAAPDDMPTVMDVFLYGVARDKGKTIAGLEQFADQMKLLSNPVLQDVDPRKVLEQLRKGGTLEGQMIQMYVDKDLPALYSVSGMFNPEAEYALLTSRNQVMLHSMDSIMHIHSLFAAVGALHLPGERGLITLLRAKGYTVEPVFSNTITNGADYKFQPEKSSWEVFVNEGDGYSIKMPGKPTDMDIYGGAVKMKSYYDLTKSRYYMIGRIPRPANAAGSVESMIKAVQKGITEGKNFVENKDLVVDGMAGKDYSLTDKDGNNFRIQLFGKETGVFMLMSYSNKTDEHGVDSFFSSFQLLPMPLAPAPTDLLVGRAASDSSILGAPPVLWQNSWNVNFSIPQQAGFSSDSKYFAMGYSGGEVVIYEAATGEVYTNYHLNSGHVYCTVFQPNGTLLASADGDGYMVLYDYEARREVKTVAAQDKPVTAVTFSRDGKLLVTGGKDKTINVWDPQTGKLLRSIGDVKGKILSLRVTNDNKTIVAGTGALSKGLRLFDLNTGAEKKVFESANLELLDISPDGRYVATANLQKSVMVYDIKKYAMPIYLKAHDRNVTDVAFSPSGKVLYSSSVDRTVIAWDLNNLVSTGVVFKAFKKISSIACSPDGHYLAVMDEIGAFSILDISKMEVGLR